MLSKMRRIKSIISGILIVFLLFICAYLCHYYYKFYIHYHYVTVYTYEDCRGSHCFPNKGFIEMDTLLDLVDTTNKRNVILPSRNPCQEQRNLSDDKANFLLLVKTAIPYTKQRNMIREFSPSNFKPVFILGRNSSGDVPVEVKLEQDEYGDLLIGNFIDSFRNLKITARLKYYSK